MAKLKLKIVKVGNINPRTRTKGFTARVITNGTAGYDDIVDDACHNTTLHKAEAKVAMELCMESVAKMLKQGYIIDLGPVGKLYPSCSSGWVEKADELLLANVTPSVYYRPAEEIASAIRGATLRWAKEADITDKDAVTGGGDADTRNDGDGGDGGGTGGSGSGTGSGDGGGTGGGDDDNNDMQI